MPVVFGPSDDAASLISMIVSMTLVNLPRNTSRNHCRYADTTKILSCRKEAMLEHGPEALSYHVDEDAFNIDCFKVGKCSMVRRVQI